MTRRRTSVIGAARGAGQPAPSPDALRQWSRQAVRELVLSLHLDAAQEARAWEDTARRWRIATGKEQGNPAPSGERSTVTCEAPRRGETWWRKDYAAQYNALRANETDVLKKLADMDPTGQAGLRDHVAHFEQSTKGTRLAHGSVRTKDAGPNLDMWHDFAPCASVGGAGLPLPLFAQPQFLAALTRQALIALNKLNQFQFIHGDLKPGNLCLAFPPAGQWGSARGLAQGAWNLKALPLRLIDFEAGFAPGIKRLHHAGDNPNWSPYLKACYQRAEAEADDHLRQGLLDGIDWGSDLWALGHTLEQWCHDAQAVLREFSARVAEHWGIDSPAHRSAQDTLSPLLAGLGWLLGFAGELQACEHPVADAQASRQAARPRPPHARLWARLEDQFKLGPGDSACGLDFQLIPPTRPLAVAHGSRLQDRAALQARAAARAATAWALRHRRAALASCAVLALAAGAAQGGSAIAGSVTPLVGRLLGRLASASLLAQVQGPSQLLAMLAPLLLGLAGTLDAGLPASATAQALARTPALPGDGSLPDTATLQALRDANLRALSLLAHAPDATLRATDSLAPAGSSPLLGHRLLAQAFHSGQALEQATGRSQPPVPADLYINALAHLHQRSAWPMAALLHLHLRTCYPSTSDTRAAALRPYIDSLAALDRQQRVNREFYIPSARSYAERLAAGQDACLLPAGSP